jgi:hypothetical protein
VLAPAPDHFPNNIGLSCKFRAGAVAKYVFSFAPERGAPWSCVPRFKDFEQHFDAPLPQVRFGFETGANFLTMSGSHSHPVQLHVVLCFCNFQMLLSRSL